MKPRIVQVEVYLKVTDSAGNSEESGLTTRFSPGLVNERGRHAVTLTVGSGVDDLINRMEEQYGK